MLILQFFLIFFDVNVLFFKIITILADEGNLFINETGEL